MVDVERLIGTVICDAKGRPLVLHHGTLATFDRFEHTSDVGFHFGTMDQALYREADRRKDLRNTGSDGLGSWQVKKVAVNARKVLVLPDDPRSWDTWYAAKLLGAAISSDFLRETVKEGCRRPIRAVEEAIKVIREQYDAIAYLNLYEGKVRGAADWSYVVFDSDRIVMLDEAHEGAVVDASVGIPGEHCIPSDPRSIPSCFSKSGGLRYRGHMDALLADLEKFLSSKGGSIGKVRFANRSRSASSFDIEMEFAGTRVSGTYIGQMGRLTIRPDETVGDALSGFVDDWISWEGLNTSRKNSVTFEVMAGETPEKFFGRVAEGIEAAEAHIFEYCPGMRL